MSELKNDEKQVSTRDQLIDKVSQTYKWWNKLTRIKTEDSIWLGLFKILIRFVGIFILLLFSPILIIFLLIAVSIAF